MARAVRPDEITEQPFLTPEERQHHRDELLKVGDGKIGRDIFQMLTARYKLLWIRSSEEDRVLECLKHACAYDGLELFRWDCNRGLLDGFNDERVTDPNAELNKNPLACLAYIIDQSNNDSLQMGMNGINKRGRVYAMLDLLPFLRPSKNQDVLHRRVKEFARILSVNSLVVIAPEFECPSSLVKEFTLIDFPLPSTQELKDSLDRMVVHIPADYPQATIDARNKEEEILNAVRGLTIVEAENALAFSLVKFRSFDIPTILDEKKRIVRKSGVLEYIDTDVSFDEIGGLDTLKEYLQMRRLAFRADAREYGLPFPKGVLLIGIPGVGKSLTCSAIGREYGMPELRLDIGSIFGQHVGESESKMRLAIQAMEAAAPCVAWIDEVEKGIGGIASSNVTDGGVTSRVMATMLTWLAEKTAPVYVVCTANNISGIPPEFLRAGRFDEIFFLDLPDENGRRDVFAKILKKKKRKPEDFDLTALALATPNYSPAEIEKGIDSALFVAYADGRREVKTEDIVSEVGKFRPLYNGRQRDIEEMRRVALGESGTGGLARLANARQTPAKANL